MTQPTPPAIPPLPPKVAALSVVEAALRKAIAAQPTQAPSRPLSRHEADVWGW
jgi:hypothetical protein